jgi:DNA repair protein RecN (Recombination protein N)
MLSVLKIKNIALITDLQIEFGGGLNLLTGETGSGKSIVVDSLGAITGDRVSSDLIKEGAELGLIEGIFSVRLTEKIRELFDESGLEIDDGEFVEIIIKREISATGKNRIFINNQSATQSLLKRLGLLLVDIHGQGEQAAIYSSANHLPIFDSHLGNGRLIAEASSRFENVSGIQRELAQLESDENQKLQLHDVLRFQVDEIEKVGPAIGEEEILEEERRRLNNIEKLTSLGDEGYRILYENEESVVANLDRVVKKIDELKEFDSSFSGYSEGLNSAQAVLSDLAFALRDFKGSLEFSPERLTEIESRLAEVSRLKKKYGGTVEAVLGHLSDCKERLLNMESSELRRGELQKKLEKAKQDFLLIADELHLNRESRGADFAKSIEKELKDVALEKARFEVRLDGDRDDPSCYSDTGYDSAEFFFSANPGESPRPLVKVASGGEASRLMLTLKAAGISDSEDKAVVFDEIDTGISGRVAEAVGKKLKRLADNQQVLCVTHQPQVAALADHHLLIDKTVIKGRTEVSVKALDEQQRIEEIARMIAGEKITDSALEHARELISAGK